MSRHLAPLLLCKQEAVWVEKSLILLLLHAFSKYYGCCPYLFAHPFTHSLSNVHEDKWPGLLKEISSLVLLTYYNGVSIITHVRQ